MYRRGGGGVFFWQKVSRFITELKAFDLSLSTSLRTTYFDLSSISTFSKDRVYSRSTPFNNSSTTYIGLTSRPL